jgi:AraC-like DNA-binding protein
MITAKKFSKILRSFEKHFNCYTAMHDFTGEIRKTIYGVNNIHSNPFCSALKESRKGLNTVCRDFAGYISEQHLQKKTVPFFKVCHAGLLELVMPLIIHDKLSGVLYIGPFLNGLTERPPHFLEAAKKSKGLHKFRKKKEKLHLLTNDQAETLLDISELLIENLCALVERNKHNPGATSTREERIDSFLARNFKKDLSLEHLAKHLLLSKSRTTQLLREKFGRGFPALVTAKRMEYAKSLLSNSAFTVTAVAKQSGFKDPAYFFNVFKKETGIPPGKYREKFNSEISLASSTPKRSNLSGYSRSQK